ncbi:MAG TPA: polymer-forming cytoskeletal protein [Candidatus Angelobacter sp.]|nr:polymer-forming cytoskeletal protein [Candidatus Angelobacter sp.]
MFSKDSKNGATEATPFPAAAAVQRGNGSATHSIISRDLKIKGDLICNGDIQIDGEVEGDVQGRSITVGEGADVRGTISSDSIRICGSVNGQLKGQSVVLAKTAKLIGDVVHQTLAVEPGAFFEGQCRRIEGAKT